jgi:glutathione peroxidase
MTRSIYDIPVEPLGGGHTDLSQHRGKVMLVVNTASKCGFTPQYGELEALWKEYRDKGLVVLGFPCNQFLQQEPGTAKEIGEFCQARFGVTFPLFAKIDVNGEHEHPLYSELKRDAPGLLGIRAIKWNFTKFLVGRDGRVLRRFAPITKPAALRGAIEKALGAQR